jgi:hypothetical protein
MNQLIEKTNEKSHSEDHETNEEKRFLMSISKRNDVHRMDVTEDLFF